MCIAAWTETKEVSAATKSELKKNVAALTNETIKEVYYTDYDSDGSKEAFVITEKSEESQTLWFSSEKETKTLVSFWINVCKGQGICKVSAKQKLFIAEGSGGGSGSWSYCYYVKQGRVCKVNKSGEGLTQTSGKDFTIYPSYFDKIRQGGGHTYKAYYLHWTGTKFEQYAGKQISQNMVKKYAGGANYLKKIRKAGYKIGKIFYRENGIININVSENQTGYDNVTLKVKGKKVKLVVIYKKGKDIVQKSSYGGIYKSKGRVSTPV
jgi:hypothetical protein